MPTYKRAQVAYATLGFADDRLAPTDHVAALKQSLVAGTRVERYGRRWFIAQWQISPDTRWLRGRLAFEAAGEDQPTVWDEEHNDVRVLPETLLQVVPYVVDCSVLRVAFELRAHTVRPGAFQGNLQALLQKASNYPWRVRLEGVPQVPWDEWRTTRAAHLTAIWISMATPNPHSPLAEIEEMFRKGVASAQLVARGPDIDLEGADLLRASFEHAQNYGKISAEALTATGEKEQWKSEEEAGVHKDEAHRDDTGHVPRGELERLLAQRAAEQAQAPDPDDWFANS